MTGQKKQKSTPQRPAAPTPNPSLAPTPDPSPPSVIIQNTFNHANQRATITNIVVTASNAITDVVSSGNPAVNRARTLMTRAPPLKLPSTL
jgi:hypothetical protein